MRCIRDLNALQGRRGAIARYLAAVAFVVLAIAVRMMFFPALGTRNTWIMFYPAVVLAALYGGLGPGLLATAASAAVGDFLLTEPVGSLFIRDFGDLLSVGIFTFNGALISSVTEAMRRARLRMAAAEADARVAAAVRESETLFRTMANAIPQLAWIARADGYIDWYNQRWYEYTGTTPAQMEGWGWQSVHDPQELPAVLERWKSSLATGEPFDMVFPLRGADGIFRPFLTRVMPLKDEQGRVQQWFGTNTDVTEQRRAELLIEQSLAEKEVLLKEIHHRVKNNMQVICSLIGLQADRMADDAMRTVLTDVAQRVRSMALIHERLFQSQDLAHVDFAEYAQSLLDHIWRAHNAGERGIRLALDLQPVRLPVNAAVPCGLILNELANNALKHAFADRRAGHKEQAAGSNQQSACEPVVAVTLRSESEKQVCLRIRDNGAGLPPGLDWRNAGTLGLHLVQMLAWQLNACVDIASESGTVFTITFANNCGNTYVKAEVPHSDQQVPIGANGFN